MGRALGGISTSRPNSAATPLSHRSRRVSSCVLIYRSPPTALDPCAPRMSAQTPTAFDEVTAISAGLGVLLMVGVGIAVYRYMR